MVWSRSGFVLSTSWLPQTFIVFIGNKIGENSSQFDLISDLGLATGLVIFHRTVRDLLVTKAILK